jgi:hypothetical protein
MDESMASARALRTTSLLVATMGAALMCAGIIMAGWADGVASILAVRDASGVIWLTGVAAIGVGAVALVAAAIMRRLARRVVQETAAVRKLARHLVAEAAARAPQTRQPEVPPWAVRSRPAVGGVQPPAGQVRRQGAPPRHATSAGASRSRSKDPPAERSDTWAAIDAMRSGDRGRRRKSA